MDTVKPLCFIRANLKCPKSMKFHLPPSLNCEEKVKPRLVSMKSKHPLLVFVIGLSGLRPLSSRALNVYVYIFLNGFSLFLFVFEGIWFLLSRCFPNTGDFVYFVLKGIVTNAIRFITKCRHFIVMNLSRKVTGGIWGHILVTPFLIVL